MSTIFLLTWNLNKRESAQLSLIKLVANLSTKHSDFIIAVQESDEASRLQYEIRTKIGSPGVHIVGNGTINVICSQPLLTPPILAGIGSRFVYTEANIYGKSLQIFNYHGFAQQQTQSPLDKERGGIASEFRWLVENLAKSDSVVILGDFNVDINDTEIQSLYCLSLATKSSEKSLVSHNKTRRTLRVRPPEPGLPGTYLHRYGSRGIRWEILDFMATSEDLPIKPRIFETLHGEQLTNGEKIFLSDHLPVGGFLELP